ncbi:MAG TPA: glycosyltransferase [Kofleriaceae bacterium]
MTLHVLHVIDGLALGGAERMLVEIANQTHAAGWPVSVCVTRDDVTLAGKLRAGIDLLVLGRQRRFDVAAMRKLARWCHAHHVDVIHCHGRSSFSLVALLRLTRQIGVPVLLHDHLGVQLHPDVPWWLRVGHRAAAAYIAISDDQRAWATRAGFAADHIHVIRNAVDLEAVAAQTLSGPPLTRRRGYSQLVAIGGIRAEKAIDVLLRAFARVEKPAVLHIIGGDADRAYADECRRLARELNVADRVVFEGPRPDALALARDADLAVHAARSESGPIVLGEYAAIGATFVSTLVGSVAHDLAHAGVGGYVGSDDPAWLASAIDEVLRWSAEERRQHAIRSRKLALELFDIRRVMPQWLALYSKVARS